MIDWKGNKPDAEPMGEPGSSTVEAAIRHCMKSKVAHS